MMVIVWEKKKLLKGNKLLLHVCWETFEEDIH